MSDINITIDGGTSKRLLTAGKFCDRDIVVTAEGGGDTSMEDMLVSEAFKKYTNNRVTELRSDLFSSMASLQEVHFPEVTKVGQSAFAYCSHLEVVDMPKLSHIRASAFSYALDIDTEYVFPMVDTLEDYAFDHARAKKLSFPTATVIGVMCFEQSSAEEIAAQNVKTLPSAMCSDCIELSAVNFDAAETIGNSAFYGCNRLKKVDFPSAEVVEERAFAECYGLESVALGKAQSISEYAFMNCSQLQTVIIRNTEGVCVCELSAFHETPLMTGQGHIYVPSAVFEYYRAGYEPALNQMMPGFFDILFRRLEDYTVDGTVTGNLDESKI